MAYPKIICLEGVDGVGKSTIAEHLVALLSENNFPALHVPSPSREMPVGKFLRSEVLPYDKIENWMPDVVGKLFEASFLETVWSLIDGREYTSRDVLILDRWTFTTLVYQQMCGIDADSRYNHVAGSMDDNDPGLWTSIYHLFDQLPAPWCEMFRFPRTYLLQAAPENIAARLAENPKRTDYVEHLGVDGLARYQNTYRDALAELTVGGMMPPHWYPVDCDQGAFETAHQIFQNMLSTVLVR